MNLKAHLTKMEFIPRNRNADHIPDDYVGLTFSLSDGPITPRGLGIGEEPILRFSLPLHQAKELVPEAFSSRLSLDIPAIDLTVLSRAQADAQQAG